MKKTPERSLEAPERDNSPGGSKISFTELLTTNIAVIRQKLKTQRLCIRYVDVGTVAKTKVAICYIKGMANQDILHDVTEKIKAINVKYVPNKIVITDELIKKGSWIFPTIHETERFDEFISDLMQGRIGVIVDNNPYGVIVPAFGWEHFYGPDDYFSRHGRFTARLWRVLGFLLSVLIPALYISYLKFHPDIFGERVKEATIDATIIPPLAQIIGILIIFRNMIDIVFRLNQRLVFFISVIGATLFGSLAVETKFTTAATLILMSLTIITSLQTSARLEAANYVMRISLLMLGFFFDWKGIVAGFSGFLIYAMCIRVYGIPYLTPLIPLKLSELNDSIFMRGKMKKIINRDHKYKTKT